MQRIELQRIDLQKIESQRIVLQKIVSLLNFRSLRRCIAILLFFLVFPFLVSLTGCAFIGDKLLNPYSSDFQCPLTDKGECIKLADAYEKSLKQDPSLKEINIYKEGEKPVQSQETRYQGEVFKKLTSLLTEPETPIIMTPKVVRVLFLPYKSDNNVLMMPRFAYFFLDEPQWTLGNYLMKGIE